LSSSNPHRNPSGLQTVGSPSPFRSETRSGSASEELESLAVRYANEAIQFDRQGSKGMAISRYQRASEVLLKLCSLYPEAPTNKVYMEHIENFRRRMKELNDQGSRTGTTNPSSQLAVEQTEHFAPIEKPNVRWNDIADLRDAKMAVEESVVYPARRPDLFPLGWPRGLLFFGPPGCGKTLLAAAIATEINADFFCVDAATVMDKWLGQSEKNVANLFQDARRASGSGRPAIIFIDEVDSLVGIRGDEVGGEVRTRNQFLKEMDSISDKGTPSHVYVVGATNKPWALDEAFIRRFQKRIFVPLPNVEARTELVSIYSKELTISGDVSTDELVHMTDGYSASDIRDILQSAQIKVVRELFQSQRITERSRPRAICMDDIREILRKRRPSVSPEMLRFYDKWYERYKAL
jgi:SpoVK/Ycf46/Vps4 family AAA+-type ATPase